MKLNQEKCHYMIAGNTHEFLWAKIGEVSIWENHSIYKEVVTKNIYPVSILILIWMFCSRKK